jgi:hypothetical protein
MVMRSTRLEFLIVTIAFVVLLLCSRPPKSGNAETPDPGISNPKCEISSPTPAPVVEPAVQSPARQTPSAPAVVAGPERPPALKSPTKRMASVDARNCPGLSYPDIMYGEVTVRWVWDGSKFVPRKVCVVKEPDGTTTAWSFDNPGSAILTEIGEVPADSQ